jgi:hypothetical protein
MLLIDHWCTRCMPAVVLRRAICWRATRARCSRSWTRWRSVVSPEVLKAVALATGLAPTSPTIRPRPALSHQGEPSVRRICRRPAPDRQEVPERRGARCAGQRIPCPTTGGAPGHCTATDLLRSGRWSGGRLRVPRRHDVGSPGTVGGGARVARRLVDSPTGMPVDISRLHRSCRPVRGSNPGSRRP